jgi:prevent-host-death family protein
MQTQWAIQNAKNQFSKAVDTALQGTPQIVTRRGVPVVVVVSAEQYGLLAKKEEPGNSFAKFLMSIPTGTEDLDSSALELREVDF